MSFENSYLHKNFEQIQELKSNSEVADTDYLEVEFDSVEQYKDSDGITHLRTIFSHDEIDEEGLWEIFNESDGSYPLELLLDI